MKTVTGGMLMPPNVPRTPVCGHARRQIAGEEGGLVGCEDLADDIRDRRIVGEVDDGELLVRIGFGRRLGGVAHQEADGDDHIALPPSSEFRLAS
jgi:hypothetical protein